MMPIIHVSETPKPLPRRYEKLKRLLMERPHTITEIAAAFRTIDPQGRTRHISPKSARNYLSEAQHYGLTIYALGETRPTRYYIPDENKP